MTTIWGSENAHVIQTGNTVTVNTVRYRKLINDLFTMKPTTRP